MTERTFRIQTGHWHNNQGSHGMSLHVEDELSGVTVLDLQLSAEEAYDLMRGSTMTLTGHHSPHLDRVGKTMVNDSVTYASKDLGGWDLDRDAKLAEGVKLAKVEFPGWESYEPRHTNSAGVTVVVRKWVA